MKTLRLSRFSVRYRPRALAACLGALAVALGAGVLALGRGDYPIPPGEVLRTLFGGGTAAEDFVVNELRLPRVVTALLVGAALALAGALFQTLVRNPLGSPDVLGFTQGAATGALLVVVAGGSSAALAGGAVAGGLATGALVYGLAWRGGMQGARLVLVGIGTAAILTGVNGYLLTRTRLMDAARAVLWLTGSLDGRGWEQARPLALALAVLVPVVLLGCGPALRALELGDDAASGLGVRPERVRTLLLGAAVLLASLAAAAAGPVNFLALTAPQLARRITRSPGPNLAASMCVGAALLVGADLAAQQLPGGRHLPVGVLTGVLGGGYLVWLLASQRRAGRL
ncbi:MULTISPECIES: iron chelate uptake ABC transporter family permease subunit [Kitasatospora]|uniref:Putative iron-siderophore ABC transporter permease protein n=1 Tax=Kitasatospora setae (strain ATCC 33774 / DSM 43861 / JCM 3304 / KCC A-0304 / NBRC 14216 / KM-6054) TaxID=452652 RepID=E4NDR5_KITSK|nr:MULTISPECIES: iron chelate uptake ABC transporter family permease subunit [Kitasatospora]BAJ29346.1 putative iron-siderophore ABC transporter permease protein [Kitasatospora setae KM-6054]